MAGQDSPDGADTHQSATGQIPEWYRNVYECICEIPVGRVATYGQVADLTRGVSVTARQVGTALRSAPEGVPWQRVVGAGGYLPIGKVSPELKLLQRHLLMEEGVTFVNESSYRVNMTISQWQS